MKAFLAALGFLTVFPAGRASPDEESLAQSVFWFPVVGLLLGGIAYGISLALLWLIPFPLAAMLLVILLGAFSGGLHLDGLADSADGLLSSRPQERMLEIMRDSRIGTMGVLGLFAVLSVKTLALISLPSPMLLPVLAGLMPLAGRCAMTFNLCIVPYARKSGLGLPFYHYRSWHPAVLGVILLLGAGLLINGVRGLVAGAASLVVAGLWAAYTSRKLGGATGDTLGACVEIIEMTVPLVYVIRPLMEIV